jgi:RNA polymerase sigma-70 factor (ECF subfamily)
MERGDLARELERLHPESWGWALACGNRDRELAEEALQTAYLRILSGRAKFSGRSTFKTWLFGVIRLTAMDERRNAGRREYQSDTETALEVPDPASGPDAAAEYSEQSAELIKALTHLSPRQREVLQLVFYHGMTIEEAAGVMQVSLGSARTHYDRGKKALAQLLVSTVTR